jgi:hypothetical protein
MRRLLGLLLLLALAPPAHAKGLSELQICGKNSCVDITHRADEAILGGTPTAAPKRAEPFVELHVTFRGDAPPGEKPPLESFTLQFLPASGITRTEEGTWSAPHPTAVVPLRAQARGIAPFPAATLEQVAPELRKAAAPPPEPPAEFPWPVVVGASLAALLAAVAALVSLRRREAAQP